MTPDIIRIIIEYFVVYYIVGFVSWWAMWRRVDRKYGLSHPPSPFNCLIWGSWISLGAPCVLLVAVVLVIVRWHHNASRTSWFYQPMSLPKLRRKQNDEDE